MYKSRASRSFRQNTSVPPKQKLNKQHERVFSNIPKGLNYTDYPPQLGKKSGRSFFIKHNFDNDFKKLLNPTAGELERPELKTIIPSKYFDIWTSLEVLPGLKLSGHNNTLTEASKRIDNLYKKSDIQNKEQYWNALDKFSNI